MIDLGDFYKALTAMLQTEIGRPFGLGEPPANYAGQQSYGVVYSGIKEEPPGGMETHWLECRAIIASFGQNDAQVSWLQSKVLSVLVHQPRKIMVGGRNVGWRTLRAMGSIEDGGISMKQANDHYTFRLEL